MGVYDSWHKTSEGEPCRDHGMVPSAGHGRGLRWQVRYYDLNGKQRKRSFRLKAGRNPDLHADAFDAKTSRELHTGGYGDPDRAEITFQAYAEDWRKSRTHDTSTAANVERRLRLHAYPVIGQRRIADLARRPSLVQAWISGMRLAPSSALLVVKDVSAVFRAAVDDGIAVRDPTRAASVRRPSAGSEKARAWTREQVAAMAAALRGRYAVIPWLGAGTGMRQGELLGLAVDDITFTGPDPRIQVRRQVKLIRGRPHFAPLKNRKPHSVPLAASLAPLLEAHLDAFPAREVTLPWHDLKDRDRHGKPVTVRLVVTDPHGRAVNRDVFNATAWRPALKRAGIGPPRGNGMHVLRHTAASVWLADRIDIVRVASWLGDTPAVVWATYAHLMPGETGDDGRAAMDGFFGERVGSRPVPGMTLEAGPRLESGSR